MPIQNTKFVMSNAQPTRRCSSPRCRCRWRSGSRPCRAGQHRRRRRARGRPPAAPRLRVERARRCPRDVGSDGVPSIQRDAGQRRRGARAPSVGVRSVDALRALTAFAASAVDLRQVAHGRLRVELLEHAVARARLRAAWRRGCSDRAVAEHDRLRRARLLARRLDGAVGERPSRLPAPRSCPPRSAARRRCTSPSRRAIARSTFGFSTSRPSGLFI